jgi:hypothetical protein
MTKRPAGRSVRSAGSDYNARPDRPSRNTYAVGAGARRSTRIPTVECLAVDAIGSSAEP